MSQAQSSMRLPNVIFIGPERTGTTWIYEYIKARHEIELPRGTKETFFFDQYYDKGIGWYERHFDGKKEIRVEVAPTYFKNALVPKRVINHIPGATLVCTLRNPFDRCISHFNHLVRYGVVKADFGVAIRECPEIFEASLFSLKIRNWLDTYGRQNISILRYDTLRDNPDVFVGDICRVLGISYLPATEKLKMIRVNPLTVPRSASLASVVTRIKGILRGFQVYWILEKAKSMGLKRLLYGGETEVKLLPREAEIEWLIDLFMKDIESLEAMLEEDFRIWTQELLIILKSSKTPAPPPINSA